MQSIYPFSSGPIKVADANADEPPSGPVATEGAGVRLEDDAHTFELSTMPASLALGAEMITKRLAIWGVSEPCETTEVLVEEDKAYEELPKFLADQLPVWEGASWQQDKVVVFVHDSTKVLSRISEPFLLCARTCSARSTGWSCF
jgi:hypothetical protein